MSELSDRAVAFVAAAIAASAAGYACGGSEPAAQSPNASKQVTGIAQDDRSRCDYKGRTDREVSETVGPGAVQPNIRRVYALVGEGEDRHKVLLCREVDTNLDGIKDVVRTYNDKGEVLNELADSNYDGKVDTWAQFSHGRMVKLQVDTNHDSIPDETWFYVRGKLSRVQRDTNHDGKPDVWEIYEEGRLQRMGVDLDYDGHVDRWDRDEAAVHAAAAKEREEEERQERKEATDAGVTDARVSARNR